MTDTNRVLTDKQSNEKEHSKPNTHSRGWELLFFFSEAVMIVFYCVGTTFTEHGHTWTTDRAEIALEQAAAT
jgi:hypothetical protein